MSCVTKGDIFNAPAPAPERVDLPEGKHVYVRYLLACEQDRLEAQTGKERRSGHLNFRGRIVALCACDEQGNRIFTDDDAEELGRRPSPIIDPIAEKAVEINLLTRKAVEGEEKN